ncbi:DUF4279 domain-containing protein [Peribacillus sp. NPDC097197]|uniref:DUF4279 domain-containing protein n=1 Tax=Peribacillus sp. NPDC097197 TaxID=3390615 RepID=UPI003D007199
MAYFSAFGEDFPVDIITNVLDMEPTKIYNKGDVINHPNLVSTTSKRRKHTDWILSTGYQESYDINDQLNLILKSLVGKTEELNQLKKKYDLEYLFMIVIEIVNDEKPAMYLEKNMIDFSSRIQAEIQFDLYIIS